MMKYAPVFTLVLALSAACALAAQPTDNPVDTRYPGQYSWSAAIQWDQIVNILDHGAVADGTTPNDDAFEQARDALVAAGGGVLYIPAGDYYFADDIALVDHVVVRGDDPAVADATDVAFRPPTRLIFPQFTFVAAGSGTDPGTAFKGIGMQGGGINTGLVNLDINRASVFAGGYGTDSENVVLLGIRSNNVAARQDWTVPTPQQHAWQIHPNRFASNISAFAYRNVLVGNCRVNDMHYWVHRDVDGKDLTGAPSDLGDFAIDDFDQPGYLIDDGGTWRSVEDVFGAAVPGAVYTFDYTNHYGINVQGSTGAWGAPPWVQPNLFYAGAVIRDNWVYCTMRVKIDASGRGLVIRDNILKDRAGKRYFVHPNGDKKVQNAATLENRGIDWRGHDVLIENNQIEVFRHRLGTGAYSSVDGEGILHQEVHGTTIDNVIIRNNTANAYIGIWKMPYTRNVLIEGNRLISPGYIYVQSDTNNNPFPMYNTVVRDNIVDGGISIGADYYSPGVLSADVHDNQLDGELKIEDHAVHSGNTKQDGVTPATVSTQTGAGAIDPPAEGVFYCDGDPDELAAGESAHFTVLVTTPSVDVERVKFYRHKTLMHTDETPPYTYAYVSDGSRALWSAKIEQPEQAGGFDPYTALLLEEAPAYVDPPTLVLTQPDPADTYVAPVAVPLEASVSPPGAAVERVEFHEGGMFIGADADGLPPYTLSYDAPVYGLYSFTAKIWGANGQVLVSDAVAIEVEGPPDGVPANLAATGVSHEAIYLSWENTASNAEWFIIQRRPNDPIPWVPITTVPLAQTDYLDSGLPDGLGFQYRVIAANTHGESAPSELAQAATFASAATPPDAPTGFTAQAMGDDRIALSWQESAGNPFGYRVDYRFSPLDPWQELGQTAFGARELRHDGLPADVAVAYRILAWNNAGDSAHAFAGAATLADPVAQTFSASGDPWRIPGRIEFEDYNPGGYYDTSSANEGNSSYRAPDSVDMSTGGTGVTIGWIQTGEWLEFSVLVESAGLYSIDIGFASPNSTGSLSLLLDGAAIAPAVVFPSTGAWSTWQEITLNGVYLPAGLSTLTAHVENSGFNLDYVDFTRTAPASYASWQAAHLAGHPAAGPTENADGDPYANEFDMLFGLDPLAPDSAQETVGMDNGLGWLQFPLAKGLDGLDWSLQYSSDLGREGAWSTVADNQLQVIAEEAGRTWVQANVPMGGEPGVFFRFVANP
jgi:hypothetical protein